MVSFVAPPGHRDICIGGEDVVRGVEESARRRSRLGLDVVAPNIPIRGVETRPDRD
jgi:hypothetical protein